MSTPITSNLLRRTTAALAAVAGLLIAADSTAANVTLNGATGNTCAYNQMTVTPDGGINVVCSGTVVTTQPGQAGSFSITSQGWVLPGSVATVDAAPTITRSGGNTGPVDLKYWLQGLGCAPQGEYHLQFANGDNSKVMNLPMYAQLGLQCILTLKSVTQGDTTAAANSASIGSPSVVTISIATSGPTTPTPPVTTPTPTGLNFAGCPAGYTQPANLITANLGGVGNFLYQMQQSQQIVAIPLPGGSNVSQQVTLSESSATFTPSPVDIEVSINKCPGLILPPADSGGFPQYCNIHSNLGQINAITWFAQPYAGVIKDTASANVYGYCWAGDANSSYYINARWTYNTCMYNNNTCGWLITHNNGPY